jgi:type II secretion system protein N
VHIFFRNLKQRIHFKNILAVKRAATVRWLAYLLFVLIFSGILIFYKFPYESVETRLEAFIAEHWGLKLDVADLRPSLPPRLKFSKFSLRRLGHEGQPIFYATQGYLCPRILPLFGGKFAVTIHAKAYGGSLNGDAALKSLFEVRTYNLRASWQAIQLERHSALQLLLARQLSGKLSGELKLDGSIEDWVNSSGIAKIRLSEGSCPIESPYVKVKTFDGLEVSAAMKLNSGRLEIDNCRFQAQGIRGSFDGIVQLNPRLYESVLDLAGQCQIDSTLLNFTADSNKAFVALLDNNAPLPFHVRGTLGEPKISLF